MYFNLVVQGACQRFALPALGRGRRSRPTGKMKRRRKLLEIAAESPASGARFVGCVYGNLNFFQQVETTLFLQKNFQGLV